MKLLNFTCFLLLVSSAGFAQSFASLKEDFNVKCAVSGSPTQWTIVNTVPGTSTSGAWECTPTLGRPTSTGSPTPGVMCTSVYGSTYNLDTSYLVSPLLNFADTSPVPTHIYLDFDSKVTNIYLGGRLDVVTKQGYDTSAFHGGSADSVWSAAAEPLIGMGDSSGWVTHEIDLSRYIGTGTTSFYIAFRYVGSTTAGSTWYLDNINTSNVSIALGVPEVAKGNLPLTVIGQSTPSRIVISCSTDADKPYQLYIYDTYGRTVHKEMLTAHSGTETYSINGLNLSPGMYVIKIIGESSCGIAKTIVQ